MSALDCLREHLDDHAVLGLGGQTVGAVLALVPVLGLVFSNVVAGETIIARIKSS